mgnify:CR=1 FL=1
MALVLLIREIDLSIGNFLPFGGFGMNLIWSSPSQLLGMVFLIPIVFGLWLLLDQAVRERGRIWFTFSSHELWVVRHPEHEFDG